MGIWRILKQLALAALGIGFGFLFVELFGETNYENIKYCFWGLPAGWMFMRHHTGWLSISGNIFLAIISVALHVVIATVIGWVTIPAMVIKGIYEMCKGRNSFHEYVYM